MMMMVIMMLLLMMKIKMMIKMMIATVTDSSLIHKCAWCTRRGGVGCSSIVVTLLMPCFIVVVLFSAFGCVAVEGIV